MANKPMVRLTSLAGGMDRSRTIDAVEVERTERRLRVYVEQADAAITLNRPNTKRPYMGYFAGLNLRAE